METLLDLLPRIERLGSREALRFWNGYRTWRWSYSDLDAGIRRFVAFLDRSGVASGDRVVLWSENRPEWVADLLGMPGARGPSRASRPSIVRGLRQPHR